jgi:hypothetical protein
MHDVVAVSDIVPKHREKPYKVCEALHVSYKLVFVLNDIDEVIRNSTVAFLAWGYASNPATSLQKASELRPTGKH